jgi:flagellar M-ring protein FliF
MNEILKKIKENFNNIFGKLSKIQKIVIFVSVFAFLIFIILFSILTTRVKYEPLFTELEPKEASQIKAQLDKMGIQYKITGNGSIIEVDGKNKYAIRLDLAKSGAVPNGGVIGFEIFDNSKIGATDFDKKMMFLRAQKGELERTISNIENIKKVTVNITPSNDSVFVDEKVAAKASILIEPSSPFEKFKDESIKSMMILAASAVEGLTIENVEVIDTLGNILSERVDIEGNANGITSKKIALQKEIEKNLEKNAASVLSPLGSGNFKVIASVELDFDRELIDKEQFTTPTVSGEQLQEGIVRSRQQNSEIYKGGVKDTAEGVAGTATNVPGYVGVTAENGSKEYTKAGSTTNYEMDKTKTKYEKAQGKIKKMTISVVLNNNSQYFKKTEFTAEEKKKFEDMVKPAIGFDLQRGDIVNVTAIPFNTEIVDSYKADEEKKRKFQLYIIIGMAALALIFMIIVFIYVAKKKSELKKLQDEERKKFEDLIPEFEEITLGEQLTAEDQERREKEEQIKQIARERPEEVANLVRTWMAED